MGKMSKAGLWLVAVAILMSSATPLAAQPKQCGGAVGCLETYRGLDYVFGQLGDATGIKAYGMQIPSGWTTLNIDGVEFAVNADNILMYAGLNGFLFDPESGLILANGKGFCIAEKADVKQYLMSFAKNKEAWSKYLKNKTCDNEPALTGKDKKSFLSSGNCTGTYTAVSAWAKSFGGRLNQLADKGGTVYTQAGLRPLGNIDTVRGSIMMNLQEEYGVFNVQMGKKGLFSSSNIDQGLDMLKKGSTEIYARYNEITQYYPPENEIVPIVSRWVKKVRELSYAWPVGDKKVLKSPDLYDFVGWNFFRNDTLALSLSHVDFALRVPLFDPAYPDSLSWVHDDWNKERYNHKIDASMWKTQYAAYELSENDAKVDRNGAFPEWKLVCIKSKKALWLNWGKFLATLTADEMRETVLAGGDQNYRETLITMHKTPRQTGSAGLWGMFNSGMPIVTSVLPNGSDYFEACLYHNAAMLAADGLALNMDPHAVNLPTFWSGKMVPGLTLAKFLFLFMNSAESDNEAAPAWSVLKNVETGNFEEAKRALHTLDSRLVAMKAHALEKEKVAASKLPGGIVNFLSGNPSREYQSIVNSLREDL